MSKRHDQSPENRVIVPIHEFKGIVVLYVAIQISVVPTFFAWVLIAHRIFDSQLKVDVGQDVKHEKG